MSDKAIVTVAIGNVQQLKNLLPVLLGENAALAQAAIARLENTVAPISKVVRKIARNTKKMTIAKRYTKVYWQLALV